MQRLEIELRALSDLERNAAWLSIVVPEIESQEREADGMLGRAGDCPHREQYVVARLNARRLLRDLIAEARATREEERERLLGLPSAPIIFDSDSDAGG